MKSIERKLNKRELDSLKKAKIIIDKILAANSMNKNDTKKLSIAGESISFAAKAFDLGY